MALAFIYKQNTVSLTIPIGFAVIAINLYKKNVKNELYSSLKELTCAFSLGALVTAPPLIRNYLLTGNPVFPTFNRIFKSPFFPAGSFFETQYHLTFRSLYDMTFDGFSDDFYTHYNQISIGLAFFAYLIPALFIMWTHRQRKLVVLMTILFYSSIFIWTKVTGPQFRYALPFVALGTIIIGVTAEHMEDQISHFSKRGRQLARSCFIGISIFGFVSQILCGTNLCVTVQPYPIREIFTKDYKDSLLSYHRTNPDVKRLFEFANLKYGHQGKGYLRHPFPYYYFAEFHAVSQEFNLLETQRIESSAGQGVSAVLGELFDNQHFDFIIAGPNDDLWGLNSAKLLIPEFSSGGLVIYRRRTTTD